jgi:hypothetical protein
MLFMSHSVFKEQKCLNFRTVVSSGFSVEAADNLSNSLMMSTRFFVKKYSKIICLKLAATEAANLFQTRRAIVAISFDHATLKFNFFYIYQRSVFAAPKNGVLFGLHRVFQRPACFEQGGL